MWTLQTVLVKKDGDWDMLDAQEPLVSPGAAEDESLAAAAEAKKSVKALIKSGAFGKGPFRVMVNGHANRGLKDDSSGPDHVQIGIVYDDIAEVPTDLEMRLGRPETHDAARQELEESGSGETIVDASAATAPTSG